MVEDFLGEYFIFHDGVLVSCYLGDFHSLNFLVALIRHGKEGR